MLDVLRPPPLLDPTAAAYKDWLHLNLFDPASGAIMLCNASLHGAPGDPRSRVIGTALIHSEDLGWAGNVEVAGFEDAGIGPSSITLEHVAIASTASGPIFGSAQLPLDGLHLSLRARPTAAPIEVDYPIPFGRGWIAWYVVPRLEVSGTMMVAGRRLALDRAVAYHDHNWGRWHWGDDVGWEWVACASSDVPATLIFSRVTDRGHRTVSGATLHVDLAGERRHFGPPSLRIELAGVFSGPVRRLPGALAALHQDRLAPRLPGRIAVVADDGVDQVAIEIAPRAALQLIAGDPVRPGYGFIHEMASRFRARGRIAGRNHEIEGLAVFEYVD